MVDSLNHKKFILKKIEIDCFIETRVVFENKKLKRILDSLQLNTDSYTPMELTGTSFEIAENNLFFHQEYSIQLGKHIETKARIYGIAGNSCLKIYSDDAFIKEIKLPDAPNYTIKIIDINNDEFNEILIYSALINGMVNLKILSIL